MLAGTAAVPTAPLRHDPVTTMPHAATRHALLCALLLGCAAGASAAEPAGPSITLYGLLDAAVEYGDDDANATAPDGRGTRGDAGLRLRGGVRQASRVGVRGVEDLGGGLRALFALEHRLEVDTGEIDDGFVSAGRQRFWAGQAWVGLQGRWGRLTAGRQYTPMYTLLRPTDATGYHFYNDVSTRFENRLDDSIEYRTPEIGGLTAIAMVGLGENDERGRSRGDAHAAGFQWTAGALTVAAAYASLAADAPGGAGGDEYGAGAAWAFSDHARIGAGRVRRDRGERDDDTWYLSGSIGLGPGTLYLNVLRIAADDAPASIRTGLAWAHPLSRRTDVYLAAGAGRAVAVGRGATAIDTDPVNLAIGLRHVF